jgi:hypothetical protein
MPTMSRGAAHGCHGSVTQDAFEGNFIDQNRDNPRRHMAGTQASQEHRVPVRRPHSGARTRWHRHGTWYQSPSHDPKLAT